MDNADLVQGMRSNIEYHEEAAKAARKYVFSYCFHLISLLQKTEVRWKSKYKSKRNILLCIWLTWKFEMK